MTFALSVIALLLGPLLYVLSRRQPTIHEILHGLIFITIAGVVCVHIVPESLETGGLPALLFLAVGLAFPILLERSFAQHLGKAHTFVLVLAGLGLIVHASIDGLALAGGSVEASTHGSGVVTLLEKFGGGELALGVILHRLPVGMAIWWSLRPGFGTPVALGALLLIVAATGVSYAYGNLLWGMTEARGFAYFQAFVAGSLVHISAFGLTHEHDSPDAETTSAASHPWSFRVGVLAGMFLMFAAPHTHN